MTQTTKPLFAALTGALALAAASFLPTSTVNAAPLQADKDWSNHFTGTNVEGNMVMGDLIIGNPDAEIEIVEYASLTCPHCANFHTNIWPEIQEKYIKSGEAKLVFRNFVFNAIDLSASKLVRCTGSNRAPAMLSALFKTQNVWVRDPQNELTKTARLAGLNKAGFDACMSNTALQNALIEMTGEATRAGVTGTPTFFVNGDKVDEVREASDLIEAIEDAK